MPNKNKILIQYLFKDFDSFISLWNKLYQFNYFDHTGESRCFVERFKLNITCKLHEWIWNEKNNIYPSYSQ